jgi:hypothetical protein
MRPSGGEVFAVADDVDIEWSNNWPGTVVRIELYSVSERKWVSIGKTQSDAGLYIWSIPASMTPGYYRIRVRQESGVGMVATAMQLFCVRQQNAKNAHRLTVAVPDRMEVDIFPNPACTHFELSCSEDVLGIDIYDSSGKLVLSQRDGLSNRRSSINISKMRPGLFWCRVATKENVVVKRLVKK